MFESMERAASNRAEQRLISTALKQLNQRLHLEQLLSSNDSLVQDITSDEDIINGLSQTPKTLPPHYFYDDRGSELFEQICTLPEYYLTRTETTILQTYASEVARITGPCELVELGSGSATKTRLLLDAYSRLGYPLRYVPIDVSGGMLESSALDLLTCYPTLQVHGLVGTYELALEQLAPTRLPTRMICFLGSTLGNLNPQECETFFTRIVNALQPGEYFLLGVDLQKSQEQLEAAYNDRQGITAEFNLNILRHLNQRFAGNFDLSQFTHWAFYNQSQHQIEMHLRSLSTQTIRLDALDLAIALEAEETILTEISRKFNLSQIQQDLQTKGLIPSQVWTDSNQWFGLILCQRQ